MFHAQETGIYAASRVVLAVLERPVSEAARAHRLAYSCAGKFEYLLDGFIVVRVRLVRNSFWGIRGGRHLEWR